MQNNFETIRRQDFSPDVIRQLEILRGESFAVYDSDDEKRIKTHDHYSPEFWDVQPLVSVHLLTYNHANYITEAIESVVNQKCRYPYEIIIGEDCSSDNTLEICLAYQKKYPKLIRVLTYERNLYRNGLLNSARIASRLRGKYIAFLEGDDYWCDLEKLEKQIEILEKSPEIGVVFGNGFILNEKGNKVFYDMRKKIGDDRRTGIFKILNEGYLTNSIMVRAESYKDYLTNSFFDKIKMGMGDCKWLSYIIFVQKYDYSIIDNPVTVYRLHSGSITMSKAWIIAKRDAYLVNCVTFWGAEEALKNRTFRRNMLSYSLTCSILYHKKSQIIAVLLNSIRFLAPLRIRSYVKACFFLIKKR